jgi:hypothetical protein
MRTKNSSTMAAEIVRSHQSTIFSSPPPGSSNTDLADSPKRISRKNMILPPDYSPGTWDVICQRGKDCNDHSKFSMTNFASKLTLSSPIKQLL